MQCLMKSRFVLLLRTTFILALYLTFVFNPFAGTHAGADYSTSSSGTSARRFSRSASGSVSLVAAHRLWSLQIWYDGAFRTCGKLEDCVCCVVKHWRYVLLVSGADPLATSLAACLGGEKALNFYAEPRVRDHASWLGTRGRNFWPKFNND